MLKRKAITLTLTGQLGSQYTFRRTAQLERVGYLAVILRLFMPMLRNHM
jgi:hypothetical protein